MTEPPNLIHGNRTAGTTATQNLNPSDFSGVIGTYAQAAADDLSVVLVSRPTTGVDCHVPFGGRKGSSHGPREQGHYAQESCTTVKTAYTLA